MTNGLKTFMAACASALFVAGCSTAPTETADAKAPVVSLSALSLSTLMARKPQMQPDIMARTWQVVILGLFGLVVLTPLLTVVQNTQPIINGRVHLPGLRPYDP